MTHFQNPLFIDIETVPCVDSFDALSPPLQNLWRKKALALGKKDAEEQEALFSDRAGIFAEFGKIIVITMGYVDKHTEKQEVLRVKGLANDNEQVLLETFVSFLARFPAYSLQLCAHNGKEFDFPYLCRRMIVQGIALPEVLNTSGKKPWEVNHLDTMEMWKFGDRKNYTSLDLLATLFGITSSKQEMNGGEVRMYYYEKKALEDIRQYCIKDVITLVQIYRKLRGLPLFDPSAVHIDDDNKKEKPQGLLPLFTA